MAVRSLIHIRHGETDWNAARRLQGSQDIPLNEHGRAQARRNGRTLARHLARIARRPEDFLFFASPLGRARATMEIVRGELGLPAEGYAIVPQLKELSFGRYEGFTYEEIEAAHPEAYARLRADKWHFEPPHGESYVMLKERVGRWYETLERDAIVVSHGGVYRALKSLLLGVHDPHLAELGVPQDRISVWNDGAEVWL